MVAPVPILAAERMLATRPAPKGGAGPTSHRIARRRHSTAAAPGHQVIKIVLLVQAMGRRMESCAFGTSHIRAAPTRAAFGGSKGTINLQTGAVSFTGTPFAIACPTAGTNGCPSGLPTYQSSDLYNPYVIFVGPNDIRVYFQVNPSHNNSGVGVVQSTTDGSSGSWQAMNSGTLYVNGYFQLSQRGVPSYGSNEVSVAQDQAGHLFMYASWPSCNQLINCNQWILGVWGA